MKPVLTFDKVSMTYYTKANETQALKDLSFDLFKGEFMSVLGPSGCGKTTILRMIGGFEEPDAGKISLDGTDITDLPPNKRKNLPLPAGFWCRWWDLNPHVIANNGF